MSSWKWLIIFEESGLLKKDVSKRIKNEAKEKKGGLNSMLIVTLAANLLKNMLGDKGVIQAFLMLLYTLTNFEIQRYYLKGPRFYSVYSRNTVWDIYHKSWWVQIDRNSLDSFVCEWW